MSLPTDHNTAMSDEYDFTGGVRGKYAKRFGQGSNVVVLDPDVAKRFRTREAVNRWDRRSALSQPHR